MFTDCILIDGHKHLTVTIQLCLQNPPLAAVEVPLAVESRLLGLEVGVGVDVLCKSERVARNQTPTRRIPNIPTCVLDAAPNMTSTKAKVKYNCPFCSRKGGNRKLQ